MDNGAMTDRTNAEERRRLAEIFGDDMPAVTSDEVSLTNSDKGHSDSGSDADEWYLSNRPPHHE